MSQRQWMEAKNPKPTSRQMERVWQQLQAGVSRDSIRQCCAACREALKRWPEVKPKKGS